MLFGLLNHLCFLFSRGVLNFSLLLCLSFSNLDWVFAVLGFLVCGRIGLVLSFLLILACLC